MSGLFTAKQSQTTRTRVPGNVQSALDQMIKQSQGFAGQEFQGVGFDPIAGLSPEELESFDIARGTVGMGAGVSQGALGALESNLQRLSGAPSLQDLQGFMNPYSQFMKERATEDYERALTDMTTRFAQASGTGGRGGIRGDIMRGELSQGLFRNLSSIDAANYDQALRAYESRLRDTPGIAGSSLSAARGAQDIGLLDAATIQNIGGIKRGMEQRGLDFRLSEFFRQEQDPMRKAGFLASQMAQFPYGILTRTSEQEQSTSPFSALMGAGLIAAGAMTGNPAMVAGAAGGAGGGLSPISGGGGPGQGSFGVLMSDINRAKGGPITKYQEGGLVKRMPKYQEGGGVSFAELLEGTTPGNPRDIPNFREFQEEMPRDLEGEAARRILEGTPNTTFLGNLIGLSPRVQESIGVTAEKYKERARNANILPVPDLSGVFQSLTTPGKETDPELSNLLREASMKRKGQTSLPVESMKLDVDTKGTMKNPLREALESIKPMDTKNTDKAVEEIRDIENQQAQEEEKNWIDRLNTPLMMAGFRMLASPGESPMEALGNAGTTMLKTHQALKDQKYERQLEQRKLEAQEMLRAAQVQDLLASPVIKRHLKAVEEFGKDKRQRRELWTKFFEYSILRGDSVEDAKMNSDTALAHLLGQEESETSESPKAPRTFGLQGFK